MRLTFDQIQALHKEAKFEGFVDIVSVSLNESNISSSIVVKSYDSNYDEIERFTIAPNGEIRR